MLHPPLRVSGNPISGSLLQCISVTDFFKINLFESATSYTNSTVILNLLHIPKVILKLHLYDKL